MHPNPAFRLTDTDRLSHLVDTHPFALVVVAEQGRPHVAHTPALFDPVDGAFRFHLARNNPACAALMEQRRALLVFTGPDAYISPDWYGVDDQVPTWNYVSAEAEGPATPLDAAAAGDFLDDLSARFEDELAPKPAWTRAKMTSGRFEAMLNGITAFRLTPDRFEGVLKLSQNKGAEAQARAAEALGPSHPIARLMAGET